MVCNFQGRAGHDGAGPGPHRPIFFSLAVVSRFSGHGTSFSAQEKASGAGWTILLRSLSPEVGRTL